MYFLDAQTLMWVATTLFHSILCWQEDRYPPPGTLVDIGGYNLHYLIKGTGKPTIVLDHSLGGIEGYLLVEELAKLSRVCIYERAGFGWSDRSPYPRTSEQIILELDKMLTLAGLEPPYILVGDSFGSYNMRLYAYRFPEKVMGLVLTDGLHESEMLTLSLQLQALKLFFLSGFLISILGSTLGIIRILNILGIFEIIKPGLRGFSPSSLKYVKRSFCRPKHWWTMAQEILSLQESGGQLTKAEHLGELPIVSIKSHSFFTPSLLTALLPLKAINKVHERMHDKLLKLSNNCVQINAHNSSHFVWVDEPHLIYNAVQLLVGICA